MDAHGPLAAVLGERRGNHPRIRRERHLSRGSVYSREAVQDDQVKKPSIPMKVFARKEINRYVAIFFVGISGIHINFKSQKQNLCLNLIVIKTKRKTMRFIYISWTSS